MRIAAFISHPIQYFTPLWQELSSRPSVDLKVHYFSRQGLDATYDPGFGVSFAWNIDLLAGHASEFLPRQWPTRDAQDPRPNAINKQLWSSLQQGWDVVFINGYAHLNNWLILGMCRRLSIPVICFADTNLRLEAGKPLLKRLAKRAVLSQFIPRVSAFLAAGGQSRAYWMHYGAPEERIFICPYAVDVQRFRKAVSDATPEHVNALRARWGIPRDKRVVMFCGKLVDWKRPLDVLHAVQRLARADTIAVFIGEGPLRAQIEREGGPSAVVTGFVNQLEIPLALSLADLLVLSSAYEPYGMVIAEGQAVGVPGVVSDSCGCYGTFSALEDGVSGFVYPTGDSLALATKLDVLLTDAEQQLRMKSAAHAQAESQSQTRAANGFLAACAVVTSDGARVKPGLACSHKKAENA